MAERTFKRKIYDRMLQWKTESNGSSALLIEGARRVGKSTVVECFARREYQSCIIIDFNNASKSVKALFDDLMDLDRIFLFLQATYHTTLIRRQSVIVFDEVQSCPMARQAIKYLVADGRYDYIETGSLVSIKRRTAGITIPSEEERLSMHPMDYEEFRWALGDTATMPLLKTFLERRTPLGAALRTTMRDIRLYMLVGGMPQAVNAYLDTNNLQRVDKVKRKIIDLYVDDFRKIDASGRTGRLFLSVPAQLRRATSRYIVSTAIGSVDEDKLTELLQNLSESKTVNFSYNVGDPNVGMALTRSDTSFKIFTADTGLFVTLAFWDKDVTENVIYQKLLSDKLSANLGYVYENLVAQMLIAAGHKLYYHTWAKDAKHNYEIDFLLSKGQKLVPIEVKSSGYNTHASLDAFCRKYASRVAERYLVYTKDLRRDEQTMLVPVCMTGLL